MHTVEGRTRTRRVAIVGAGLAAGSIASFAVPAVAQRDSRQPADASATLRGLPQAGAEDGRKAR